jgi:hypothetical protein
MGARTTLLSTLCLASLTALPVAAAFDVATTCQSQGHQGRTCRQQQFTAIAVESVFHCFFPFVL